MTLSIKSVPLLIRNSLLETLFKCQKLKLVVIVGTLHKDCSQQIIDFSLGYNLYHFINNSINKYETIHRNRQKKNCPFLFLLAVQTIRTIISICIIITILLNEFLS